MPILNKQQIVRQLLSLSIILFTIFTIFSFKIDASAQLGIEPFSINKSDPNEKGWFKYNVEAGAVIDDFVVISNLGAEDASVDLRSNDAIVTDDGAFTIISNDVENKELGKWVELKENIVTVPAGSGIKVPFKINVPSGIAPGEYAGGLSITEVSKDGEGSAPLAIRTRIGSRIYLTVKGDLSVASGVKDLAIINPDLENFNEELNNRGFILPKNMVFKFTAENTGNVYTSLNGGFNLTLPDGKPITQKFSRNLAPRSGPRTFYIETNIPYQVGKTTINLDYATIPQNKPSEESGTQFSYNNDKGSLSFTMDIAQEELDKFIALTTQSAEKRAKNNPTPNVAANQPLVAQAPKTTEAPKEVIITKTESPDNTLIIYIGAGVGLLVLILIALVAYKLFKDNGNKSKEPKTSEKASEAKKVK